MKTEIERLQDLVSNLRRDLCNALMQSRSKDTVIEKCKEALETVWEVEEMGYTPDDPESESAVCTCDKCEGVQRHNHRSHSDNCPQPIIEDALTAIAALSEKEGEK